MSQFKLTIGGALVAGDRTLEVINPATEALAGICACASEAQLNAAVAAAKEAFAVWSRTPIAERKRVIDQIADVIAANTDELARLLTLEQGKPIADATMEVYGAMAFFRYFAALDLPVKVVQDDQTRRIELHRRPLGVVAAITPWNFPLGLAAFKVPAALLAGNTVVLKPAATTPLATLRLGELIQAVLPPGVVNVIADANDLGGALTAHPDVRKVSFTGSTATGKKVMAGAADGLKRLTLELGGNDAAIVLDDVDPQATARKIFRGAFVNNGQVCIAIKRVYAHEAVYDALCDELARLADAAVIGDGLEQGTELGPLQNRMQYDKVKALIEDAGQHGTIIAGGVLPDRPGYFIRPTIVRDIADGTRIVDEEQFGPVLPVVKFSDPRDAVERANGTPWGLGGSIWSNDVERAHALAQEIESGTVWINHHVDVSPAVPTGGAKQSGLGVELGEEGLNEFTQLQVINLAR